MRLLSLLLVGCELEPEADAGALEISAGVDPARNLLLFAFLVIVVQSSDVLQYIWGKLLGKHLIAPKLSPSKTVEGFVGGVLLTRFLVTWTG